MMRESSSPVLSNGVAPVLDTHLPSLKRGLVDRQAGIRLYFPLPSNHATGMDVSVKRGEFTTGPIGSDAPLVSIIITVFNRDEFLREAVGSALRQTYGNVEVIVSE